MAVAISGAGCICAAGMTLETALASMLAGKRQPQPPVAFATGHAEPFPVFEITEPLPISGYEGELLRSTWLAINAAQQAMTDAGLQAADLAGLRVGVCIGTTVGSSMNNEEFYRDYRAGADPDMAPISRYLRSNPAAAVAEYFKLDGPCQVVVNACSSGTDAIGIGAGWIRAGLCDLVLAGGADELCRTTYNGFASLMITANEPCRPFGANRKGLNLGEGAGMLILESRRSWQQRQKQPRGYLLGYGSATDAYHLTAPHPDGTGLRRALQESMQMAGISSEEIAFINAHGTGTQDNDRVESKVLAGMFPQQPFTSTKFYTGHALGAAGAIEAALSLACLEQGRLPGNPGDPDPELSSHSVAELTELSRGYALSASLAFGGNNAAVVLGLEVPE